MRATTLIDYLQERKATELRLQVGKPPTLFGPEGERALDLPQFDRAGISEILARLLWDEKEAFARYKAEGACDIEREYVVHRRTGKYYRIIATSDSARFVWDTR
jgi:hypothetical protein